MFNPKISGIIAGVAFILSFLIGLFTGSQFFPVLLRAFVLGLIFFVLVSLSYWLINQFLPELLTSPHDESNGNDILGSKVDISIDGLMDSPDDETGSKSAAGAVPAGNMENSAYAEAAAPGQIFSNRTSFTQGLDQNSQDDYNGKGEGGISPLSAESAVLPAAIPEEDESESIDVLPDLDSMSGSFAPSEESDDESDVIEMEEDLSSSPSFVPEPSRTKQTGNSGDFNVQEMASAIQTILRRDEKG